MSDHVEYIVHPVAPELVGPQRRCHRSLCPNGQRVLGHRFPIRARAVMSGASTPPGRTVPCGTAGIEFPTSYDGMLFTQSAAPTTSLPSHSVSLECGDAWHRRCLSLHTSLPAYSKRPRIAGEPKVACLQNLADQAEEAMK